MLKSADSDLSIYYVLEVEDCFGNERGIYAGAASPEGRTKLIRIGNDTKSKSIDNHNQVVEDKEKIIEKSVWDILLEGMFNKEEISVDDRARRGQPGFFC